MYKLSNKRKDNINDFLKYCNQVSNYLPFGILRQNLLKISFVLLHYEITKVTNESES